MIFAFITKTPALIIDNSTNKVLSCFKWIEDCGYISPLSKFNNKKPIHIQYNFEKLHNQICTNFNFLRNINKS